MGTYERYIKRLVARLRKLGCPKAWGRASARYEHMGAKLAYAVLQRAVNYEVFVRKRVDRTFERARVLQPADVPTLVWLGNALLDEGKPEAAEPHFIAALAIQPRLVAAEFGLGRAALARQDYARAVEVLERALSHDPKATIVHYPLALAYRGLGDSARATAHMQQRGTLDIKPDDPLMHELDTLLHSALAYEVAGADALDRADWAAAADSFRKGIALAPEEPSLHHKLGTALALKGDTRWRDGTVR